MNKKIKEFRQHPERFIYEILDDKKRWSKQIEVLHSVRDNQFTYVKSAHSMGKSFVAKDAAMWFLYNFYPSIVITLAPSWPQVEKILWGEIRNAHKSAKVNLGGDLLNTELKLNDNWYAIGLSPRIDNQDQGKRLTGFHEENVLIIFDEAPDIDIRIWEIVKTSLTGKNVRFLGIGNPVANVGPFYDAYRKGGRGRISMSLFESPNFTANNISTIKQLQDIQRLDEEEREALYETLKIPYPGLATPRWAVDRLDDWGSDSPLFLSRVLGEFPTTTNDTIISLTEIERCKYVDPQGVHKKTLGVDVARFGSDDTILYGYESYRRICREKYNGQDLVKTANRIIYKIKNELYKVVIIDDTGLGGGVTDIVKDFISNDKRYSHVEVIPVNFAQKSSTDEYDGIVTEMYYNAQKLIKDQRIQMVDEGSLFNELTSRKYKFKNGKIKLESKDEYKKRTGGKSPDEADAFVLCMWGLKYKEYDFNIEAGDDRYTNEMDW